MNDNLGGFITVPRRDREAEFDDFASRLDRIINLPYQPLIDDGVRVNIAPLQKLGLLKHPVLASKDVARAIADRNRWREDDKEQNTIWRIYCDSTLTPRYLASYLIGKFPEG